MTEWWNSLELTSQVFYGIGIISLVILICQMLLTLLGLGGDHELDLAGAEHDSGLGLITFRTLTAFFVGFGWAGAVFLNHGHSLGSVLARATVVGAAFLLGAALLVRALLKLQSSGNLDYSNAIGTVGTVYSTIPGGEAGNGQLELMIQGRLLMADALTQAAPELKPGSKAKVVALVNQSTFLVEPVSPSPS